jgi:putative ABC transport system permease protein
MREDVLGDLQETYAKRASATPWVAFWYLREAIRLAWGYSLEGLNPRGGLIGLGGEIRSSCRSLIRRPALTAIVVATLGLGIGANAAIFTFFHGVFLQPLPFRNADRLVQIESEKGGEVGLVSIAEVYDMREQLVDQGFIDDIAAFRGGFAFNIAGDQRPEEIPATLCTSNLFEVLGVSVARGSSWPKAFDRERGDAVLLHHGLWKRRFGSDPEIAGRKITLDADWRYTIHGVLAPELDFPFRADVYRSLILGKRQVTDRKFRGVLGVARLRQGVSIERLRIALDGMAARLAADYPDTNSGYRFRATPIRDVYVGAVRPYIWLLVLAAALVLLMACSNVVNVLLVRASSLYPEVTIRSALGASRARLVRQRLVESLLLAVLGGCLGVALSVWSVQILSNMVSHQLPSWIRVHVDGVAIVFSLVLSIVCGFAAGLAPALISSQANLAPKATTGSRASSGPRTARVRRGLVAGQVALATVLLIGAGLVIRSFDRLQRADLGYDPANILTARVALPYGKYSSDGPKTEAFYRQLLEKVAVLPGVELVALNHNLPMAKSDDADFTPVVIEGQSIVEERANPYVALQRVTSQYFRLMEIPLKRGRMFDEGDQRKSTRVAIVSEQMVRRFWPNQDPVGKRIRIGSRTVWSGVNEADSWMTVVGVVGNVIQEQFSGDSRLALYVPLPQMMDYNEYVLLKTQVPPLELAGALTRAVLEVDPEQSNYDVLTMQDRVDSRMWRQRVVRTLFSWFGGLAAVLCAVGIYGVMAHAVTSRTREIGIRIALGAGRARTVKGIVGEAATLALAGLALGLMAGFAFTGLMRNLLYEVSPTDPLVFVGAPLLLAAVAIAAALVPAWRAVRIEPIAALRHE